MMHPRIAEIHNENLQSNSPKTPTLSHRKSPAPTTPAAAAAPTGPPVLPSHIQDVSSGTWFKVGRLLGKGGFAYAYLFTDMESGVEYAAKVVLKSTLTRKGIERKLRSEIRIHRGLDSPHIVGFKRSFEDAEHVFIVLELCANNSLMEMLRARKRLTEPEVQYFGLQLVAGLRYLHEEARVIHRDLKLGNLLLTKGMDIRLADFGLAAALEKAEDRRKTVCGTPNYIAPEVLEGGKGDGHGFEVDVWSFGVVLYTLLLGKPPFETGSVQATYKKIKSTSFTFPDTGVSDKAKDLISRILTKDPAQRPSLQEIERHAFFHGAPVSVPESALYTAPYFAQTPSRPSAPMASLEAQFARVHVSGAPRPTPARPPRDEEEYAQLCSLHEHLERTLPPGSAATAKTRHTPSLPSRLHTGLPRVTVLRYVDLPNWGLGYLLSNGVLGVRYNDNTLIAWPINSGSLVYLERDAPVTLQASEALAPDHARKKVRLVKTFYDALADDCTKHGILIPQPDAALLHPGARLNDMCYMRRHLKMKHAMFFRLSCGTLEMKFFDKSEIAMAANSVTLLYRHKAGPVETLTLDEAVTNNRRDVYSRAHYLKNVIAQLIEGGDGS